MIFDLTKHLTFLYHRNDGFKAMLSWQQPAVDSLSSRGVCGLLACCKIIYWNNYFDIVHVKLHIYCFHCRDSLDTVHLQLHWHVFLSLSPLPVLCLVLPQFAPPPLVYPPPHTCQVTLLLRTVIIRPISTPTICVLLHIEWLYCW